MKEAELQKKVLNYLSSLGAWHVKTISTNKSGTPDILCCYKGLFIAIELKRPDVKAKGSPLQEHQISKIKVAGGIAFVANNLDQVKTVFSNL